MDKHFGRRGFLERSGSLLLGLIGVAAGTGASKASARVFAGRFLEDSHVMKVPPGQYNPELRMYLNSETGEPAFNQRQAMTQPWTPCTYSTCMTYDYNHNCLHYDSDRCTPSMDWD